MRLYIADDEKLTKFDLPKEVQESFVVPYRPANSKKEYTINIESGEENWILKSNGLVNLIRNGQIVLDEPLKDFFCYELETDDKKRAFLYCLPTFDENNIDISTFNAKQITIGNSQNCNIWFQNNKVSGQHVIITVQNGKAIITANQNGVFLNELPVRQAYLKLGDVVFLEGLKLIWMGNFIRLNNPLNSVLINGMQVYQDLSNIDNSNYEKSENNGEHDLYKDEDYFYHFPKIKEYITTEELIIDAPPGSEKGGKTPLILSLGTSITMGLVSLLRVYQIIEQISSGDKKMSDMMVQLVTCFAMIVGSLLLPIVTRMYTSKIQNKREKLRQEKYGKYLNEKELEIKNVKENQKNILLNTYPSTEACCKKVTDKSQNIWDRNISDEEFLKVRLGLGNIDTKIQINAPGRRFSLEEDNLLEQAIKIAEEAEKISGVPITADLKQEAITSVISEIDNKDLYINNIILQLVTNHSPLDLKIVFLSDTQNKTFEYMKYMPHIWSEDKTVRFYSDNLSDSKAISEYLIKIRKERIGYLSEKKENQIEEEKAESGKEYASFNPYYLIITDCYKKNSDLEIIKSVINSKINVGFSMLIIDNAIKDLPPESNNFIYLRNVGSYILEKKTDKNVSNAFNLEKLYNYDMNVIAGYLSNIPTLSKQGQSELPKSLTFLEMYKVSKIEQLNILGRWKENDPTMSLKVPIGVHADRDLFILDLHEKAHGPHGLIAGSTGSGKSEFIITFILSMAINYHPYEVQFVLIDYKGGGLAGAFENREKGISIPHLAGTITNLDTSEMNRTLVSINSELKRRQAEFNKARDRLGEGTVDIYKYQRFYREGKVEEPISHLFIISDEFAELKSQQPDFMDQLISTARIGRSLGVHLILATQKPSGVVNDQIWANSKFKICLKVQSRSDSMEMLKRPEAASIKETGRFYLQVGYDEYFDIGQSGYSGARYTPSDRIIKKVDDSIEVIDNIGTVIKKLNDDNEVVNKVDDMGEQLPNIVRYIVELSKKQDIKTKMLWLSSIPDLIYVEGLKVKYNYEAKPYIIDPIIGEYDNPAMQEQGILTVDLTHNGNTLIYGKSGSGKENLLTTMIYNCCTDHSPEEINFYILDFGAETLKIFSKYPHVGGVATIDDQEMLLNLFKMLFEEMDKRKELFVDYGGNYQDYINESGKKLPLINIVINGFDVFNENFSRLVDSITPLIRDGFKYGMIFTVTTTANNGVNSRTSQMFINVMSLQQKNDDSYRDLVSAPRGLTPKRYFGRGIVNVGKTGYEFQTAYISTKDKINQTIRNTAEELNSKYSVKAMKIKTLPNVVDINMIGDETTGIDHVAIGVNKATLNTSFYNFNNLPLTMILSEKIYDNFGFVYALVKQFSKLQNVETTVLDATKIYNKMINNVTVYKDSFEIALKNVITNVNKEGQDNVNRVFIFIGPGVLKNKLDETGKKLFDLLFNNISRFKKSKIILIDDYKPFKKLELEPWYSKLVVSTNGIWLGPNPNNQNSIDFSSITREQLSENFPYIAYTCGAKGIILFKYVVDEEVKPDE